MTLETVDKIIQEINQFDSVSLDEINAVKLLNRTDTKFAFNIKDLPSFLKKLKSNYKVLTINDYKIMRYKSLYFDTPELELFTKHQNGKLNRYKVRIREYVETETKFLETKFKTNKERTVKIRKNKENGFELDQKDKQFIREHTKVDPDKIQACIWVNYSRMTLVNNSFTERITLDINLSFDNLKNKKNFPLIAIAEVKRDKLAKDSFFTNLLRDKKIPQMGLSKYCIGIASTFEKAKYNNIKPKILTLNKIALQYV